MTITNRNVQIHSGPDEKGRYLYTVTWDDDCAPGCSRCGGSVEHVNGMITCVGYPYGSTLERRRGCGLSGTTMPRGHVFNAPLASR